MQKNVKFKCAADTQTKSSQCHIERLIDFVVNAPRISTEATLLFIIYLATHQEKLLEIRITNKMSLWGRLEATRPAAVDAPLRTNQSTFQSKPLCSIALI